MKLCPYYSNGDGGVHRSQTVVMVKADAAQLDAYGRQRSYKARPSKRMRINNHMNGWMV